MRLIVFARTAAAVLFCAGPMARAAPSVADTPAASAQALGAIDPLRLLPPPPLEGSAVQAGELAELRRIQADREPASLARAEWDNAHEDASAFEPTLGSGFDLAHLPQTARLLAAVRAEQSTAKKRAKADFHRPRPWVRDPSLVGCPHGDDKPNSSYPSGHATMAFAMAVVLADLIPDRAQDLLARAADYSQNRLVCGVHFRSDIVAGQAFGTAIGVELLASPHLQAALDAARNELRQAGVAQASNAGAPRP